MLNIGRPPFLLLLLSSFFLFRHAITSHDIPLSLSLSLLQEFVQFLYFLLSSNEREREREGKLVEREMGKKSVYSL